MLTDEDRRYILNEHLRNIDHISDIKYQRRVWILGIGPECDDFDETCCHFFDDGDPILENYKDFLIKDDQYQVLKRFRDVFDTFSANNNWPPLFIETSEWANIMDMAKDVLKAFNYK